MSRELGEMIADELYRTNNDFYSGLEQKNKEDGIRISKAAIGIAKAGEKEVFESLGFTFSDAKDGSNFCYVKLPEGWQLDQDGFERDFYRFLDEAGNYRGAAYRGESIELYRYYDVRKVKESHNFPSRTDYTIVYFGPFNLTEFGPLYVAGQVPLVKHQATQEERRRDSEVYRRRIQKLEAAAEVFGNENYPDYKNPGAYWPTKTLTDGQGPTR